MNIKHIAWIVVGIGVLIIGGWALVALSPAGDEVSDSRPVVAATIFPLADMVQALAGEMVRVEVIIPPGASEHSRDLSPQLIGRLQRTDLLFAIGHGLDDLVVERTVAAVESLELEDVVMVDTGISLREFGEDEHDEEDDHAPQSSAAGHAHDEGIDPHYWLTVPNGQQIARNAAAALMAEYPNQEEEIRENLDKYLEELAGLEQELQVQAAQADQKAFIAMHDAWSYLAAQYGFKLVDTFEPREGLEPSPAALLELQETIQQFGIEIFYAEPQKISTSATRFLQNDLGLEIRELDPVGGRGGINSYVELMRFNVRQLSSP